MKHHGTDTCVMREDHVGKPADHGLMCEECRAEDRAMTDDIRKIVWSFDMHVCVGCRGKHSYAIGHVLVDDVNPDGDFVLQCTNCGATEGPFAGPRAQGGRFVMDNGLVLVIAPIGIWLWRKEIVNLVSDCIAEGIRKSKERRP